MLTALDLFAGAGGLSLGLHAAGWQVVAAVERNPSAAATYRHNFPDTALLADVCDVDFKQFTGLDLVAGGPPCQPFSVAGKQLSADDPRDMVPQFVRAISEAQPRAFLLENVPGLLTVRNLAYVQRTVAQLKVWATPSYTRSCWPRTLAWRRTASGSFSSARGRASALCFRRQPTAGRACPR